VGPGGGNHIHEMPRGKRNPWIRRLTIASALILTGGFCFSWLVGSSLVAPAQRPVALPPDFAGSEVNFTSASGATLRGNFLKGESGKGVVILMHGVRGNRGAMAKHAKFLHAHGFSVLLFDFQAHGESSGSKITSGYLESMDASAAIDFARKQMPGEKIAILGSSLGGAAAVLAEPPLQVDAMILEMVYPDIRRAVKNRIAIVLGNWARAFSPLLTSQIKLRIGVSADWLSPEHRVGNLHCPKLIIGGANDLHTTLADTRALYGAAAEPKELWIIENATHEDLHARVGSEYERRVLAFLDKSLRSPKPNP
jgi:alpha-beta hydrolase superfamily lysophospholipase